jgi:hypothetical protein
MVVTRTERVYWIRNEGTRLTKNKSVVWELGITSWFLRMSDMKTNKGVEIKRK